MLKTRNSINRTSFQWFLTIIITFFFCSSPLYNTAAKKIITPSQSSTLINSYVTMLDISAGSDTIVRFSAKDQCFYSIEDNCTTHGLSDVVIKAIVKSPRWIQHNLTRQFQALENPEPYAWLLINASKKWTDELAFSLASSPLGDVADVDVLYSNVAWLYELDQDVLYADIIDYDSSDGNYYSTIQYKCIKNGTTQLKEYPKELYYWFVVHPELLGEHAQFVYDTFWRSFLYSHNDIGYPLLKEKISSIEYLWDNYAYSQPRNRIWDKWISNHPTAIEAASYWIGKTVPSEAIGDRPNQPNIIAHEHNGWCGELQRLAVAAMRTLLIPTVSVCNIGEDHVWREFYDEGWHQNDNWWTDSGGTVDTPDVYWDGWGKSMSSIYAEKGDGSIYDVTSRYIEQENRLTVTFDVVDGYNKPYDGARVTVLVKGLKDITWYKNTIWDSIDAFWNRLPDFLKNIIFEKVYEQIQQRFNKIPDVVDGVTISIWNYTDLNGRCNFKLGNQDEYIFLIQGSTSQFSWPYAKWNTVRVLRSSQDTRFQVKFPDFRRKMPQFKHTEEPNGIYQMNVSYSSYFYQVQENIRNHNVGTYIFEGSPLVFLLDSENLEKYKKGQSFQYLSYGTNDEMTVGVSTSEDVYIVLCNPSYQSQARVNLSIDVTSQNSKETIAFVSPSTTLFDHPSFNVGDIVTISGVSTVEFMLIVNEKQINFSPGLWSYSWNTSGLMSGENAIQAVGATVNDTLIIHLFDATPPTIDITDPENGSVVRKGDKIYGCCNDASGIYQVEVRVDDSSWILIGSNNYWSYVLDDFSPGIHRLMAKATDTNGLVSISCIDVVVNASNPEWYPSILSITHTPAVIENNTNVVIYANISSLVFPIKIALVSIESVSLQKTIRMFPYGHTPILSRHPEDPLYLENNSPVYGCELGIFSSGETVRYRIGVIDMAGHSVHSEIFTFSVE